MIELHEKDLNIVKAIFETYLPGVPVWVFGSRIHGSAKPYSDLDLVIVGEEKIPQRLYYQIMDAFEESELPFRVDVLDWHRINQSFRELIQKQYVVLN